MRRKWLRRIPFIAFVFAVVIATLRPADQGRSGVVTPDDAYFSALNPLLKQECRGLPCAVLDLDRLDHNIKEVKARIKPPLRLRIIVKSLPSIELIRYVLEKAGTRRLMVFHGPHINYLMKELGSLDILVGKPIPAPAARQVLQENAAAAESVQWLVDTSERLSEYLEIARELKLKLKINLEIDVGLHRGGARDGADLAALLRRIHENPEQLRFSGLMGYDGHVSHAPSLLGLGSKKLAMRNAFDSMLKSYAEFVRQGKAQEPAWFDPAATLNGGGSHTYAFYEDVETPINDISLGSALVKPADFEDASLASHQRAVFLAIPILKKLSTPPIPYSDALWGLLSWWDRNVERGFYLYGAVWDSEMVHPRGLRPGWFYEPEIRNLLPNQSLVSGSSAVKADVGDYVFLHPREGDAISVYRDIIAVRGAKSEAHWKPFSVLN